MEKAYLYVTQFLKDKYNVTYKDPTLDTWYDADVTLDGIKYYLAGDDFFKFNEIDLDLLIEFKAYCENLQIEMRLV